MEIIFVLTQYNPFSLSRFSKIVALAIFMNGFSGKNLQDYLQGSRNHFNFASAKEVP